MDANLISRFICLATVLSVLGCGQSSLTPTADLSKFPTIVRMDAQEPVNRDDLDGYFPGSSSYLAALEKASPTPLMERVRQHCPYKSIFVEEEAQPAIVWSVETAVPWGPYRVFLIGHSRYNHQVILRTRDARHHMLLLDVQSVAGAELKVVQVAGQSLLVYRAGLSGNSGARIEEFFTIGKNEAPELVEFAESKPAIGEILPEGYFIWNYDGFEIEKLRDTSGVWRPGDGHALPTGGRIRVDYELLGHMLIPKRYCYDADFRFDQSTDVDWEEDGWGPFTEFQRQ